MKKANINVPGYCHLLRHAMANHMLENGAEPRIIQAMLGHANYQATQVYTHVSIQKLQEIHSATHPAKHEKPNKNNTVESDIKIGIAILVKLAKIAKSVSDIR